MDVKDLAISRSLNFRANTRTIITSLLKMEPYTPRMIMNHIGGHSINKVILAYQNGDYYTPHVLRDVMHKRKTSYMLGIPIIPPTHQLCIEVSHSISNSIPLIQG